IHYSGHGGRAATIYPNQKGEDGVDESLVPTDIGNSEARYLRDLELAQLLQDMVDKGLVVTVALDSCHSGGSTRAGVDADIRGANNNIVDTTPRPTESLVATPDKLAQTWQTLTGGIGKRNVSATSGWLPEPKGYTLFAACRDDEYAYEDYFDGQKMGALTYWLLNSLNTLGTQAYSREIHNRILAKIYSQSKRQTPMLQGEGDRPIFSALTRSFGSDLTRSNPYDTVTVMNVDLAKNRVSLQAGEVNGIVQGAEFAIYRLGTTDFTDTSKRVALAKVVEVDAVESWAEVSTILGQGDPNTPKVLSEGIIEQGASALLLNPGVKLVRKVRLLLPKEKGKLSEIEITQALEALKAAKAKVKDNAWIEFLSENEVSNKGVSYYVSINKEGEYEILDAGGEPIINLRPFVEINEPDAAAGVVNRLVHLSKYDAILHLDNNDLVSSLNGKLKVELGRAENRQFQPFNAPGNVPILDVGEYAFLRIRNESTQHLNITALAIQPDWSIEQLFPTGAEFEVLGPGKDKLVRIRTSLPESYKESADVIKVFATVEGASFRWIKLPALDQPRSAIQEGFKPSSPLEELFAAFADDSPSNKNLSAAAYPSEKWTTEQVKLVVKKM
ncbi:MAG TPA: caspase family protein, partial [Candidatus Sericytochromatia bacterium]